MSSIVVLAFPSQIHSRQNGTQETRSTTQKHAINASMQISIRLSTVLILLPVPSIRVPTHQATYVYRLHARPAKAETAHELRRDEPNRRALPSKRALARRATNFLNYSNSSMLVFERGLCNRQDSRLPRSPFVPSFDGFSGEPPR